MYGSSTAEVVATKPLEPVPQAIAMAIDQPAVSVLDTEILSPTLLVESEDLDENIVSQAPVQEDKKPVQKSQKHTGVFKVPFYSQFSDISQAEWKKVGCGIASLAMLIDFHESNPPSVDELLEEGIAAHAYLSDAGWTHTGLINLSKKYGLSGSSHDMSGSSMATAFDELKNVLKEGPVMVSVHYTFDPKNPIPHLVVVSGVDDGKVFYNDPAEKSGGGSISIAQFQSAWKKRYIEIHPA